MNVYVVFVASRNRCKGVRRRRERFIFSSTSILQKQYSQARNSDDSSAMSGRDGRVSCPPRDDDHDESSLDQLVGCDDDDGVLEEEIS